MKKSKIASRGHRKRSTRAALKAHHKHLIRKRRPIHKRILLHPVSVFVMLCVGVFLVGWTVRTFAENLTVTASILAPLPASAADITWPADQTHFTASTITITGTCPSNTYVELYRNGSFSGEANCGPSVTTYQILTDLNIGSNDLYTRIFNITNNEGPQSTPITIWYDQPRQTPAAIPPIVPKSLIVLKLDKVPVTVGSVHYVSPLVTIVGVAPAFSYVVATFFSTPTICATYADSNGNWSCTLDEQLADGSHTVSVIATTTPGETLTFPTILLYITPKVIPLQQSQKAVTPFIINHVYHYQIYASGKSYTWNFSLSGGVAPYALTILWGDGSTSTVVRSNADSFDIAHTYSLTGKLSYEYTINVKTVDSVNNVANLQLSELVTYNGTRPGVVKISPYNSILNFVRKWVWLIWPAYAVVLLMTTSFWLGEREEYIKIIKSASRRRKR